MEEERQELAEKADTAAHTESMADFEEELNASLKQIHEGDVITGTVIDVTEDEVVLDLKYYTEGVIRREDFSADPTLNLKETVQVGDEISATVVRRDGGQGQIMLSKKDAANLVAWDKLRSLKETQSNIRVKVAGIVKSGVIAYVEDIRGFIPASKLALDYVDEDDLNDWLGKELEVRAITVDEEDGKLVLSAKEILREKEAEEKKARISNVQVGLVTEGKVESIQPYGAFIDLGNGLTGLVHISQICEKRIKTPAAVLHVGDEVKVKVIAVKDGKLSLSMNLGSLFANIKLN